MPNDSLWTGGTLEDLRREFGDVYEGRTVLVTGADGFMGSHLTDALVELGAIVHAFVRANSSGALNNIGHLRERLKVHFADLTDRTSVDYLVRELKTAPDRPYVFHLGAQAHVGESWHRPYETVAANVIGTLNLLQAIVDWELEVETFDTAGTSEEYGIVRETVADHHDFDDAGLVDSSRQRIPACEPEWLEVVVVHVGRAPVRPGTIEEPWDLCLEPPRPEGALGRIGVDEEGELEGREAGEAESEGPSPPRTHDRVSERLERRDG